MRKRLIIIFLTNFFRNSALQGNEIILFIFETRIVAFICKSMNNKKKLDKNVVKNRKPNSKNFVIQTLVYVTYNLITEITGIISEEKILLNKTYKFLN